MRQSVVETLIYFLDNPILILGLAGTGGFVASRIVAADRRPGVIGFTVIGFLGFFLSHFVIAYAGWNEYLDSLRALRVVIDFVGTCIGSFVLAGLIHFLKPS